MHRLDDYRLRPMAEPDKARILAWRNSERVRVNMYTDHLIGTDEHERWFAAAQVDDRGRYLVFENSTRPLGFVSFTGTVPKHGRCSWAFYLGEADVKPGTGSVMEFLALDYAFGALGIRKLCCEVFVFNTGVVRLHERFGFQQEGLLREHYRKGDKYADVVVLARFAAGWPEDRAALQKKLFGETNT